MKIKTDFFSEDSMIIRRDDTNYVVIAHIDEETGISYTLWKPVGNDDFWVKREIEGKLYGMVGCEWPSREDGHKNFVRQFNAFFPDGIVDFLSVRFDDNAPIAETKEVVELWVYVEGLVELPEIWEDIKEVMRDARTTFEEQWSGYEKVVA